MRKYLFAIFIITCLITTTACSITNTFNNGIISEQNQEDSATEANSPNSERARTIDLSDGISNEGLAFSGQHDFDCDGNKEDLSGSG